MKPIVSTKNVKEKQKRFEDIYDKYCGLVMKVAVDMTSDFRIAEELCQSVFMLYFVNMNKIIPGCDKTWLMLTTRHMAWDYLKKASTKYERTFSNPWEEKSTEVEPHDTIEERMKRIAQKELSGEILSALKRKNRSWYRIMYGIYIEELSTEEVAESLGISISMLYSKMYRAKNYIRKRYGDQYLEYLKSFEKI